MGEVWLAEQTSPVKRQVALKIIKLGMDTKQIVTRFEAERQALAMLDHPNIAKLFDAGTTQEGRPYFVMELVRGTPITEFCDTHRLTTRERIELFADVCRGVHHAHARGIIHRDLKPSNIIVASGDQKPVVKLIDFGIAKALGQNLTDKTMHTRVGQFIGTPEYMSPEQADLSIKEVDGRSDVYSLGIILYQLIVGARPYEVPSSDLLLLGLSEFLRGRLAPMPSSKLDTLSSQQEVATVRGTTVGDLRRSLRGGLDAVAMKALEHAPARRYQTALSLAEDLDRYLAGEPLSVAKSSMPYAVRRVIRRSRLPAAVVTGGLLAWMLWPSREVGVGGFEEDDITLISRCENATGDPNLDGVLTTALEAAFRQSRYVTVISHDQARAFAEHYLGRSPPIEIDPALANELGVRGGYKVVIHCALRRVGDSYQVATTLTDPRDLADLATLTESAAGDTELVDAIDALATRTREALGESLRTVQESKPLAAVTTSSLDALTSFTAAQAAEVAGDRQLAFQLFESAIARDSLFARAHAAVGNHHFWAGNRPAGEASYRNALRNLDRVSDRDRLWIEASFAAGRGDNERAVGFYRNYVERWPDDRSAWYNLGNAHFRMTQCDEAGRAFARALAIDPTHAGSHINLASCLSRDGIADSALIHYDSAFRLEPSYRHNAGINHEYGFLLVRSGRSSEAEEVFEEQSRRVGEQGASGRRSAALLHMYRGEYSAAAGLLEESAVQRQALGQPLSEYRDRLYLAGVYDVLGRTEDAQAEFERAGRLLDTFYAAPSWLIRAVERAVWSGQLDQARALAARAAADTLATSPGQQASLLTIQALVAAAEGDMGGALEHVGLATEMGAIEYPWAVHCRIAVQAGEVERSRDVCGTLLRMNGLGWENQESTMLAHFWLGRIAEEQGDLPTAREHYASLLDRWGEADSGLTFRDPGGPPLDVISEVRARLRALQGAS